MDKNKTDKLFYPPSRINLSDEDVEDRPHGITSVNEDVIKKIQELKEIIAQSQNKVSEESIKENKAVTKLTSREIQKQINQVKKMVKLGKKEKGLLKVLSDCEPHSLKSLTNNIQTKDIKHLKKRLKQKISRHGFIIKTHKVQGLEIDSFYQLKISPN